MGKAQKDQEFSKPGKPDSAESGNGGTRRRGQILEDAILEGAWQELSEVGYNQLTMEGVAARAKTNKAVIYRRYSTKAKLVVAALHKFIIPLIPKEVPDTGNLRDDVFTFLQGFAKPLQLLGVETIHGLLADHIGKELITSLPMIRRREPESELMKRMRTILKNAEKRGEVKLEKIKPRIILLPMDLFRYEMVITQEPITEETLTEIVDDIFMPLVRR
ncbi:MAG TPA: TetR family transcriptional regulator [Firmicutes bacterium]|nr:TetR family transcriptional regulator [Bacillota bacterium]